LVVQKHIQIAEYRVTFLAKLYKLFGNQLRKRFSLDFAQTSCGDSIQGLQKPLLPVLFTPIGIHTMKVKSRLPCNWQRCKLI
jgi:hypothetical protein